MLAHRTGAPSVVFAAMPSGLAVRFVLVCFLFSSGLGLRQCSLAGTLATSDDIEIPQLIRNIDVSLRLLLDNTRAVVDRVVPGPQDTAGKHDAFQHLRMHVDHRLGQAECRVEERIQQAESRLASRLNSIHDELAVLTGLLRDVLSGRLGSSHAIPHALLSSRSSAPTPPYRVSPPNCPSPPSHPVSRPAPPNEPAGSAYSHGSNVPHRHRSVSSSPPSPSIPASAQTLSVDAPVTSAPHTTLPEVPVLSATAISLHPPS